MSNLNFEEGIILTINDKIAIANIVATIVLSMATISLSIFVYKATKKSADAAEKTVILTEETLKFSKGIQERQYNAPIG